MSLKSRGAKVDFMPLVESSNQPQFPAFPSRSYKRRWKLGGDSPPPPPSKLQRNLSDWRGFKAHYCPQKPVLGDQLEKKNCEIANGALVAEEWKGKGGLAHNGTRPKPRSCFHTLSDRYHLLLIIVTVDSLFPNFQLFFPSQNSTPFPPESEVAHPSLAF